MTDDLQTIRDELAALLGRVDAMLAPPADLVGLHRTTAIERVLEQESPLGPAEIARRLRTAGRTDRPDLVQVTTNNLMWRGRIARVGVGLYSSLPGTPQRATS